MNVLVVGSGTIGSTVAYTLSVMRPSADITLVDADSDVAEGHAIDIRHSTRHAGHAVGRPDFVPGEQGTVRSADPDPELVDAADSIVVTASVPRPEGGSERGGRLTFLEQNLEVADDIASWLQDADPTPVVAVTNPVDRITHRLWTATGWPRRYFLGYALSERARITDEVARRVDAAPRAVSVPILGEHGEHIVPVFSRATVDGEPIELSPTEREEIREYVRNVPYEVMNLRDPSDSSRWVSGRGVAGLVARLDEGSTETSVCLSTPLDGEYGFENVSMSVPVRLGPAGVEEIVEWSLTAEESDRLDAAYEAVRPD